MTAAPTIQKLTIGKMEAARRQLETAIDLYSDLKDPVSIHTLAAAAYGVIRGVNEKTTGDKMIKDYVKLLPRSQQKKAYEYLNGPDNFFKHGHSDPNGTCVLNPAWTDVLMFEACQRYHAIVGEIPPLMQLFVFWFFVSQRDLFENHPDYKAAFAKFDWTVIPTDRRKFFATFRPFAALTGTKGFPDVSTLF